MMDLVIEKTSNSIATAREIVTHAWKRPVRTEVALMSSNRAGRYVQQSGRYAAFDPAPLPPVPLPVMDEELWRLLSDADRALGRLDGVTRTLPDTDIFVLMYVRKEAVYSSQIEGTQASLDDLVAYEDNLLEAENPFDVEEVVNYVRAINRGMARLRELPVSLRLIREIHGELMQGGRGQHRQPGEFRQTQNWIGPAGSTLADALFMPPAPHEIVAHLAALETFIHSDSRLPILVQIGLIHAQFETIHPFLDGNGRLGRLLITFLLCEREILKEPVLYLSHYFKAHRSEYYQRLQDVRDHGDWEGWLKFFMRGVRDVAREAANTAARIVEQRQQHLNLISQSMSHAQAGSAFKLIEHLHRSPVLSIARAASLIDRTYANARILVLDLVDLGLLEEVTGRGRNKRYRYTPYMALLGDRG